MFLVWIWLICVLVFYCFVRFVVCLVYLFWFKVYWLI